MFLPPGVNKFTQRAPACALPCHQYRGTWKATAGKAGPMPDRACVIVGPNGWFYQNSPEFLRELGDPAPNYDAVLFAVRNLGFVRLESFAVLLEITLNPKHVEERTLQRVQRLLPASNAELFRVRYLDICWRSETLASARDASVRLFDLCAAAVMAMPAEDLRARRC